MFDDVDGLDGELKYIASLLDPVRGKLKRSVFTHRAGRPPGAQEHTIQSADRVGRGHR
jgi:hypothetical protein